MLAAVSSHAVAATAVTAGAWTAEQSIYRTRAWIDNAVVRLNLCPYAAKPFHGDRIRYAVSDCISDEALVASFFQEGLLLLDSPEEELATTMLIAPKYEGGIGEFYSLYEWLTDLLESEEEEVLANGVQPAFFHPAWSFDGLPADSPIHFEKRAPCPVINLLRRSTLDRTVEARRLPSPLSAAAPAHRADIPPRVRAGGLTARRHRQPADLGAQRGGAAGGGHARAEQAL